MAVQKVLILEPFDIFRNELKKELMKDYCICDCATAQEASRLLQTHCFDALFINLRLEGMDGLMLMEQYRPFLPPVIITVAPGYSLQLEQRLIDLGVSYPVLTGVSIGAAARHLRRFLENANVQIHASRQEIVATHLRILGVSHLGGFEDLRVGVPIFAQDPDMSLTKEFYPAVAALRGRNNWQQVEKAIRAVKETAYENRNEAVWQEYFADTAACPKNRDFIARLAEFVR